MMEATLSPKISNNLFWLYQTKSRKCTVLLKREWIPKYTRHNKMKQIE